MELHVVENTKNKLIFDVKGADHTICNPIKQELYEDDNVKISTYRVEHPLVSDPQMIVETSGSASPKSVISKAISRLKKTNEKIRKDISKEIK